LIFGLLAAEPQHAGGIRLQVAALDIATTPLDLADLIPPPSGKRSQLFSINPANGPTAIKSAGEVLYLAFGMKVGATEGGFFRMDSTATSGRALLRLRL
jgi:hypothetical protein